MSRLIFINSRFLSFILLIFLISSTLSKLNPNLENLKLIFVYQHIRHGARGPTENYNSLFKNGIDEFGVSWEGEGDGELTLIGKREHYDIGIRNRHKYGKEKNGLGLIDFSTYNPEEVLFHATDYNRTHQSLNSELIGMYQPGILKTLSTQQINASFPPNNKIWEEKKQNESLYNEIIEEINSLGNKTIIENINVFNVHPFAPNRTFNLETNCKNLNNLRLKSLEGKENLLYGYFLNHSQILKQFFKFENISYFTNIDIVNSITDHYISDYKNLKDLSNFHNFTGIDLDEFMNKSTKFYYDWMYNYYCTNITCSIEASRLMEDLLEYMKKRIKYEEQTTYKAPKLVIDCGHDTTVAPIQMFMYQAFKDKPDYNIRTQYCGFACNIYFELYKSKDDLSKYYVFYYIDDELINVFDYNEFDNIVKKNIYTQEYLDDYCRTEDEKKKDSFSESFKNHKLLWIGLFSFIFTTILGIVGIIILYLKVLRLKHYYKLPSINIKEIEMPHDIIDQSKRLY